VRRTISIKIFDVLVLAGSVAATGSVVILFFLMARNLCSDTFLAMGMSVNNDTEAGTLLMPGTVCVNTAMTYVCVHSYDVPGKQGYQRWPERRRCRNHQRLQNFKF
jgi:hypothetical protein